MNHAVSTVVSPAASPAGPAGKPPTWAVDFLPDPDELERRQLPAGFTTTLYLLLGLVASAVLWASLSEVDSVVTARGKLVTQQPTIVMQGFESAQITALNVRAGQVVKKGQVLAVLDPTFVTADLTQARDRLKSLDAELARLDQEQNNTRAPAGSRNSDELLQARLQSDRQASYQARLTQLDEATGRLQAALLTNQNEITSLESRMKSLREIEAMNEELTQQNFQSKLKLLESRERRQEVERDLTATRNRTQELRRQLAQAQAEQLSFKQEWRQKSTETVVATRRERDGVAEQLRKAEQRSRLIELVAPVDAVVLEVAAKSAGSVLRESEQLFTLVPLGGTLEAEVQIEAQDVGFVKLSDPVRLKIDAFPFQKHGQISGTLDKLGQDSFTRDSANGAARPAFYLGRAAMGPNTLRQLPRQSPLIPGMTLSAEIVVGKRSVISYLMYPVMRGLSEAASEP